ncbi:MAG TPA: UDP-N-acetylmuramate--L-alanine ligase [Acidimicrobiia bacterium]
MADLSRVRRIHLVGVGGTGMNPLARLLAGRGYVVSGSDVRSSEAMARLEDLGLEVWAGHRPESVRSADLVVASSAVPDSDAELAAAGEAGVPVWRRPQLLEALTRQIPTIGPTGTHGKTSTTALMVLGARAAGLDPAFVVGGEVLSLRTNAAAGSDDLFVLEVDEAFATFESVHLEGLVVTNIEAEHLEHFGTFADLEAAFARVVRGVNGPVVVCRDDPGAARLAQRTGAITYGTSPGEGWQMTDVAMSAESVAFTLSGPAGRASVEVPRPGIHIARNAAGALALLAHKGIDIEAAARGVAGFGGVRRRFELKGVVSDVTVIDDYAHHPTEVAATLRAAAAGSHGRLWAVFQPHLYSRTERLSVDFGLALASADRVVVTDVYGAREEPRPGVTGQLVADAAVRAGAPAVDYVAHRADLAGFLAERVASGDTVITMGAGDITVVPGELLALLAARAS